VQTSKCLQIALSAVLTFVLVASGGNSATPPKSIISAVYVMGDSLADVGSFGFKFTVHDSNNSKGYPVWPGLVANVVGLDGASQCNVYSGSSPDQIGDSATS
jgi:hypothetical protein